SRRFLCWKVLHTMTTASIISALQRSFSRLGPPRVLICDNAKNLNSSEMRSFLDSYGTKLENSTSYHPQGNSIAEPVHRTLHRLARLHRLHSPGDLKKALPKLVYVYNCRPHKAQSPYYMLFG
ncbi:retrovirus polyprotein, putative, partial [Perkinsus marinus ATCC 50983]